MDIQLAPIEQIKPYELNPRFNEPAVEQIMQSIKTYGFRNPIIVDKDMTIITGHTRYKAALRLGMREIPTIIATDMTDDQVRGYRIADNKLGEIAEWDLDMLAQELGSLEMDPTLTGFTQAEIDAMLDGMIDEAEVKEDDFDEEDALEKAPTVAQPGEIWQLGKHRLMVGDATKREDVQKLMDGAEARLILTDPPYNVNYTGGTGLKIDNDNMDNQSFYEFLLATFKNLYEIAEQGAPIYVFHADTEGENFRRTYREAGFKLSECLMWVKSSLVMGRNDYHWKHEPLLYGWKEGAAHHWYGGRAQDTVLDLEMDEIKKKSKAELIEILTNIKENLEDQSTVIHFKKPSKSTLHPTMKPLGLLGRLMANSSQPRTIVVDTFGGSGSTLIVAEQLERVCYMMEMDPRYADVIIFRYEEFTGQKAERISD